jgi:hypothetical protein
LCLARIIPRTTHGHDDCQSQMRTTQRHARSSPVTQPCLTTARAMAARPPSGRRALVATRDSATCELAFACPHPTMAAHTRSLPSACGVLSKGLLVLSSPVRTCLLFYALLILLAAAITAATCHMVLRSGWAFGGEFCMYYFLATVINEFADCLFVVPTHAGSFGWKCAYLLRTSCIPACLPACLPACFPSGRPFWSG